MINCLGGTTRQEYIVLNLTAQGVEVFIKRSNNVYAYWDNYDLIIWKENPAGLTSIKGLFKRNAWGIHERIAVSGDGTWKLPKKYVRHFK